MSVFPNTTELTAAQVTAAMRLPISAGGKNEVSPASLVRAVSNVIDVASLATGGSGTSAAPYTGWAAAFNAAVADGVVFLFRGVFSASANLNLDNHSNVTLRGLDGHIGQVAFNTPEVGASHSEIRWASMDGPHVSARNTVGVTIENLSLKHTSSLDLTTGMVNASGPGSAGGSNDNVSLGLVLRNVLLAVPLGDGTPVYLLLLDNTVETLIDNCCFYGAQYNLIGTLNYSYATAVTIRNTRFHSSTQCPIRNPHWQWLIENCVFEPGAGAHGKWVNVNRLTVKNLTFLNCYQWDTGGSGDVLTLSAPTYNLALIGCTTCSVGGTVVKLDAGIAIDGLTLVGNSFENNSQGAGNGTLFPSSWVGSSITKATIHGNTFGTGVDNISAAVSGGQLASGLVVNSAGTLLLPSVSGSLPDQSGHSGEFLTTNGTVASWAAVSGGSTVAVGEQRTINTAAVPNASVGGWADYGSDASAAGIFNSSPADGDYVEFKVFLTAGTYTFDWTYRTGTDSGKVQASLDGTDFGTLQNVYNAAAILTAVRQTGVTVASSGVRTVRLTVNGKDASSSNYYARLGVTWTFTRTA